MSNKKGSELYISDILQLEDSTKYKLHLGCYNGDSNPLDLYIDDENEWKYWNEWRNPKTWKNEWNREYIFSLIEFYLKKNTWLFGGIFKVIDRPNKSNYILEEVEEFKKYDGRLLFNFERYLGMRGRSFLLEKVIWIK